MVTRTFDPFEPERRKPVLAVFPWVIGLGLLTALLWFIYTQLNANGIGVAVEAPSPQAVSMLPPPPPPPPPPPVPKEKPPEPTEQAQPSPTEAAKPEPKQATPMAMDAPAQTASPTDYGLQSGPSGGMGKPGVCLNPPCSPGPGVGGGGGGGMTEAFYRRYLSTALRERVQGDNRLGRLIFSADYSLTITPDGRVGSIRIRGTRGASDADMAKLTALLGQVRGLDQPPPAMVFPQLITVRGRKSSF